LPAGVSGQIILVSMIYEKVYIEGLGVEFPPNVVTSAAIDAQLAPVYEKLKMAPGSLEMMTGLKERRFWDDGTRPSQAATRAAVTALENCSIRVDQLGALINCSVCRDYLEPATATLIARNLGLSRFTTLFDVSNACLGFATGLSVAANMIELGQVESALVVSSEAASEVVENTIKILLERPSEELFLASIPSLTLGSGAAAFVLTSRSLAQKSLRFKGGVSLNDSHQSQLCLWGPDTGFPSKVEHSMVTDGKTLLEAGTELASKTWAHFRQETGFRIDSIDRVFCHQVGMMHRNMVFDALSIPIAKDYSTFELLGNSGSSAMPIALAKGIQEGAFSPGQKALMMGIGSGLVCTMYGLEWER
jgi:acyl-CoA:acyl-CoA alkyltransferase